MFLIKKLAAFYPNKKNIDIHYEPFSMKFRTLVCCLSFLLLMNVSHQVHGIDVLFKPPLDYIDKIDGNGLTLATLKVIDDEIWVPSSNGVGLISSSGNKFFNVEISGNKSSWVTSVAKDNSGVVWVTLLHGGVYFFDLYSDDKGILEDKLSIKRKECLDVVFDDISNLLLLACGKEGVFIFDLESEKLNKIDLQPDNGLPSELEIEFATINHDGEYIFAASDKILFQCDRQFICRTMETEHENTNEIYVDERNNLFISASNGVFIAFNDEIQFRRFSPKHQLGLTSDIIYSVVAHDEKHYLVSTKNDGILLFNLETLKFTKPDFFHPFLDEDQINMVFSMVRTDKGGLALASGGAGIFLLPATYPFFDFFDKNDFEFQNVTSTLAMDDSLLFSDGKGIYRTNQNTKEFELFSDDHGTILDMILYGDSILVSSGDKGTYLINKQGVRQSTEFNLNGLPPIESSELSGFEYFSNGNLLVGAYYGDTAGAYYGNESDGFDYIIPGVNVEDVFINSSGEGVVVDTYGIHIVAKDLSVTRYLPDFEDYYYVQCAIEISKIEYLLCLRYGNAAIFNTKTGKIRDAEVGGNILSKVNGGFGDGNGNFWIAAGNGLHFVNFEKDINFVFNSADGLESTTFPQNSMIAFKDNWLIIPGSQGVVKVHMERAADYVAYKVAAESKPVIQSVAVTYKNQQEELIFKQPVATRSESSEVSIFHHNQLVSIKLNHNNFSERKFVRYQIKFEGLYDGWRDLALGEHLINYYQLAPGEYNLKVRIVDPKSSAKQPIESLNITVFPPWWQTTWARLTYLFVLIIAIYFVSWFRNKRLISSNRKLSQKVEERTETISRLLQQKQTFFANVSHEFRTPLALIMGPLDAIADKLNGKDDTQQVDIMRRNTNRLMRLVDQILDLAKIETSKSLPKQVYEIKSSIGIIAASFSSLLESKQQSLMLRGMEELDELKIRLIEDSLEMMLSNLISNAIKYCPENTQVTMTISVTAKHLILEVADNGKGISPENLEVLFERFTRFDAAENIQGSGIGLALVKQLVSSNNGEIEVASKLEEGTTFTISLPLNVSADEEVTRTTNVHVLETDVIAQQSTESGIEDISAQILSDQYQSGELQARHRLLIVEDNQDLRTYVSESLKDTYDIEMAINGEQGVQKALESVPDLILSDILMPIMDGYELANAVRSNEATSHIPIILLTAKGDDMSRMRGWEEQVDDYLTKPFKMDELKIRINRLLAIRDILRKKHTSEIGNNLATKNQEVVSFQTKRDKDFFARFEKMISEHYSKDDFSRADAASYLALSERQLNRKLSALVDYNFSEYLRKYRLQKSTELLTSGMQVTEVAYDVGFNSPSYFSSCFKAEFDKSPSKYVEDLEAGAMLN